MRAIIVTLAGGIVLAAAAQAQNAPAGSAERGKKSTWSELCHSCHGTVGQGGEGGAGRIGTSAPGWENFDRGTAATGTSQHLSHVDEMPG